MRRSLLNMITFMACLCNLFFFFFFSHFNHICESLGSTKQNIHLLKLISSVSICLSGLGVFIIYRMRCWARICVGPPSLSVAHGNETAANGVKWSNNPVPCSQSIRSTRPLHRSQPKDFTARPEDNMWENKFQMCVWAVRVELSLSTFMAFMSWCRCSKIPF